MTIPCRLLVEGPQPGAWNMARDEAVLNAVVAGQSPATWTWYLWERPTLSLGYFQHAGDRVDRFADLAWVRRTSGGGAILHHYELTYSVAIPAGLWPQGAITDIVRDIHSIVAKAACRILSLSADLFELHPQSPAPGIPEPFLCFLRRAKNDLVVVFDSIAVGVGTHKVLGSAQRGRRGALLQHGSILISRSEHTPELLGLLDVSALQTTERSLSHHSHNDSIHSPKTKDWQMIADELQTEILQSVSKRWDWDFYLGSLTHSEIVEASEFETRRYGSSSWNEKR